MWALLHYLGKPEHEENPEKYLKLHHINCHMMGNWNFTANLINYAIEKELVRKADDNTFHLTDKGRMMLPELRRMGMALAPEQLAPFLRRTGEQID